MGFPFKKDTANYALYGAMFGLLFPIASTLLQAFLSFGHISCATLIKAQQTSALLYVIDTAPFFLGIFAMFAGIQVDKINNYSHLLESMSRQQAEKMIAEMYADSTTLEHDTDELLNEVSPNNPDDK